MRKSLFKKITATVLSLSMIVGLTGVVSAAHAANGANVANRAKWSSFSVCTREDGGEWEDALKAIRTDDYPEGQIKGKDYATEGYATANSNSSYLEFFVKNSGWDGNYDPNGNLVGDNPWGMWAAATGIPVERGRYYTISFKIKSTLYAKESVDDKTGEVKPAVTKKHILFKAYDPISRGEPGVEFISVKGGTTSGMLELNKDEEKQVTAVIKIPDSAKLYAADYLGIKFAMGANVVSYPNEVAMSGYIKVSDFKVVAGDQYQVTYTNGSTTQSKYVNKNAKVTSVNLPKKGYTLTGYKTASGARYNFNTPVTSNLKLTAIYTKTAKPAKPKITTKSSGKKKISVKIKKAKRANGYQIQYSYKKNMKGAKKKIVTSAKSYTIKKLKSRKFVYVKVRAFAYDSAGNKVFGKLSSRKKVYVK